MKKRRIAIRIASAILGVSLCFGASASARARVSYSVPSKAGASEPVVQELPTRTTTATVTTTTAAPWTTVTTITTITTIFGGGQPQSLNTEEMAAQLDVTN